MSVWTSSQPFLPALLAILIASGCSSSEQRPPLYPVTGILTINDQPADGAIIVLHPADGKDFDTRQTRPRATVYPDGTFYVTTYQDADGAPAGDYHLAILWFDDPESSSTWDQLSGQFADPTKSQLKLSVQEGDNQIPPFELKDVTLQKTRPAKDPGDADQVD